MITLYDHQLQTVEASLANSALFDMSDPGTGKTIAHLYAFWQRYQEDPSRRLLVMCPKSITYVAWGRDIEKAFPEMSYTIASAENRAPAFAADVVITIVNIDGVKWLAANPQYAAKFTDLIIDESTSIKNRTSDRSKATQQLVHKAHTFEHVTLLSGTPSPQGVVDLWHQAYILDGGLRLGKNYFAFQAAVCSPQQNGPSPKHLKWIEKPGMNDVVAELLRDITVRHSDRVLSLPPNRKYDYPVTLSRKHAMLYDALKREAILQLSTGTISSFHKATLRQKLLQLLSGAAYDDAGGYQVVDTSRYELIMDLMDARRACVVPFMWTHQRDGLLEAARARGFNVAVIDGAVKQSARNEAVRAFQAGELKGIFIHPRSAAHGITLTYGSATIWPSPIDDAELFIQLNKRIDRNGQTAPTETIMIHAEDTIEGAVYDRTLGKTSNVGDLLALFEDC